MDREEVIQKISALMPTTPKWLLGDVLGLLSEIKPKRFNVVLRDAGAALSVS